MRGSPVCQFLWQHVVVFCFFQVELLFFYASSHTKQALFTIPYTAPTSENFRLLLNPCSAVEDSSCAACCARQVLRCGGCSVVRLRLKCSLVILRAAPFCIGHYPCQWRDQASKAHQAKHKVDSQMKQRGNNLHDRAAETAAKTADDGSLSPDDPDNKP